MCPCAHDPTVSTFPHDTTQDTHDILDLAPIPKAQPIDVRDLFKVSHTGALSSMALPVLHSCLNNHMSSYQASVMMDLVLQDENRRAFSALMSAQTPATKAIARTLLPSAIKIADIALVKTLLAVEISPDLAVDYFGTTPLNLAIEMGNVEMTELLLSYGAEVNLPISSDDCRSSPLTVAAENGRVDIMRLLLDKGADVNAEDGDIYQERKLTRGPLRTAVACLHLEAAELLLDAGANIDARREYLENSLTALQTALEGESSEMVDLLLSRGAKINFPRTSRNSTALDTAVSTGDVALVQLILSHSAGMTEDITGPEGSPTTATPYCRENLVSLFSTLDASDLISAMEIASGRGHMEIVSLCSAAGESLESSPARACKRMAIKAGVECGNYQFVQQALTSGRHVNVDAPALDGDTKWITPLQWAAKSGRLDLVQLLECFGAKFINPPVGSGWTLIQGAVSSGNVDLVRYLLISGVDVNAYDANSSFASPLASAAHLASLELFQVLQEAGLNMIKQGPNALIAAIRSLRDTSTSSWTACKSKNSVTIIKFLVNLLGPSNAACSDGIIQSRAAVPFSPTDLQFLLRSPEFTDLLLQRGLLDVSAALVEAIRLKDLQLVLLLLLCNADVDNDPLGGPWALREAAISDRLDILHHLVHGANPREKARALQAAAQCSKIESVRLLIEFGADVNASPVFMRGSKEHRTALQAAAENGNLELVQLLITDGAEVERLSTECHDQGTALQFAAIKGHIAIVNELMQRGANVNALPIGEHGRTALEGAAEHGRLDMVQLLLNFAAETHGSRALRFAKREGHEGVVALLLENGFEDVDSGYLWSEDDESENHGSEDDGSADDDY